MTGASHDVFVDRRTPAEQSAGLATQILFWYDKDRKGRTRTNGMAVTTEGYLVVARSTCSRKDQFVKSEGRKIVTQRIFGVETALSRRPDTQSRHVVKLHVYGVTQDVGAVANEQLPEMFADAYEDFFTGDQVGHKRAYNAGKVFARYRAEIERRANELLDDGPTA